MSSKGTRHGSEQPQGRAGQEAPGTPHKAASPSWAPAASWALPSQKHGLLLSIFLWRAAHAVSSPGLAFSGLTPESHDQATAHLCDGDELCQGLDPEDPQVHGDTPHLLPAPPPIIPLLPLLPGQCQV